MTLNNQIKRQEHIMLAVFAFLKYFSRSSEKGDVIVFIAKMITVKVIHQHTVNNISS